MKDLEIGSFEAKNRLSELLTLAEKGQRIYITRRGKRVAMLVDAKDEEAAGLERKSLLAALQSFRGNAKKGPESLRDLIAEGRR